MNYYRTAQYKYKKAQRIIKLLRYMPFTKMIAVVNSLSFNRALPKSDIDLFIITKRGRIWTARFFSVALLILLRARPVKAQDKNANIDKVCLTFFISEGNLNLEQYKISPEDTYLVEWIHNVKPLYVENAIDVKFFQENNWAALYIPDQWSFGLHVPNYKRRVKYSSFKPLINLIASVISEDVYKYIQLKKIPLIVKQLACAWDTRVVISDRVLKFHLNDRRLEYNAKIKNQNTKC